MSFFFLMLCLQIFGSTSWRLIVAPCNSQHMPQDQSASNPIHNLHSSPIHLLVQVGLPPSELVSHMSWTSLISTSLGKSWKPSIMTVAPSHLTPSQSQAEDITLMMGHVIIFHAPLLRLPWTKIDYHQHSKLGTHQHVGCSWVAYHLPKSIKPLYGPC